MIKISTVPVQHRCPTFSIGDCTYLLALQLSDGSVQVAHEDGQELVDQGLGRNSWLEEFGGLAQGVQSSVVDQGVGRQDPVQDGLDKLVKVVGLDVLGAPLDAHSHGVVGSSYLQKTEKTKKIQPTSTSDKTAEIFLCPINLTNKKMCLETKFQK